MRRNVPIPQTLLPLEFILIWKARRELPHLFGSIQMWLQAILGLLLGIIHAASRLLGGLAALLAVIHGLEQVLDVGFIMAIEYDCSILK